MNILVVAGYCLRVNSSANLCHLSYINGLIECGHTVDLLTVSEKNQIIDEGITMPPVRHLFTYDASLYEQIGNRRRTASPAAPVASEAIHATPEAPAKKSFAARTKAQLRKIYGPHRTSIVWYHNAKRFQGKEHYDLVISLSDPPVSHKLVGWLLKKKRLSAAHWLQIWEDPWGADINGYVTLGAIHKEESSLLRCAERVLYVSPLTLLYQQRAFPEFADKMEWMPLPAYYQSDLTQLDLSRLSFGYFGDYTSHVRNLEPFYQAAAELALDVRICGNSDMPFPSTETIQVYRRLPLDQLKLHEDHANVLVFLCNRKGGQIPGKIYQYSATNKPILFILDGTDEEKVVLRDYFSHFNRYLFCENDKNSIIAAINRLLSEPLAPSLCTPVNRFAPRQIITEIVNGAVRGNES